MPQVASNRVTSLMQAGIYSKLRYCSLSAYLQLAKQYNCCYSGGGLWFTIISDAEEAQWEWNDFQEGINDKYMYGCMCIASDYPLNSQSAVEMVEVVS